MPGGSRPTSEMVVLGRGAPVSGSGQERKGIRWPLWRGPPAAAACRAVSCGAQAPQPPRLPGQVVGLSVGVLLREALHLGRWDMDRGPRSARPVWGVEAKGGGMDLLAARWWKVWRARVKWVLAASAGCAQGTAAPPALPMPACSLGQPVTASASTFYAEWLAAHWVGWRPPKLMSPQNLGV